MESRERTKLYLVIGLSVLCIAIGYFRFLHGKITFFKQPERGVASLARVEVPAINLKGIRPAGEPQKKAPERVRAGLRDIFAPVKVPASEIPSVIADVPLKPLPPLQLTGTIVSGKRPMAIINGRFLRKGEIIAGLEVVSIARDHVILSGEGRKVLLNILTGAEVRSP
jgi:hypothetical protein